MCVRVRICACVSEADSEHFSIFFFSRHFSLFFMCVCLYVCVCVCPLSSTTAHTHTQSNNTKLWREERMEGEAGEKAEECCCCVSGTLCGSDSWAQKPQRPFSSAAQSPLSMALTQRPPPASNGRWLHPKVWPVFVIVIRPCLWRAACIYRWPGPLFAQPAAPARGGRDKGGKREEREERGGRHAARE